MLLRSLGVAAGTLVIGGVGASAIAVVGADSEPPNFLGRLDIVLARIRSAGALVLSKDIAVVEFPGEHLEAAAAVYDEPTMFGLRRGLIALRPKGTHNGCRVPLCATSGWWEDSCDGSAWNRVGEKVSGPAPRGLDRWTIVERSGPRGPRLYVDTTRLLPGAPLGTRTIDSALRGPHCA
jgi:hypothetical protein